MPENISVHQVNANVVSLLSAMSQLVEIELVWQVLMFKHYVVNYRKDNDPAISGVNGNEKGKKHLKMLFKIILY